MGVVEPRELLGAQGFDYRFDAVVAARAATGAKPQLTQWKVDIVVDYQQLEQFINLVQVADPTALANVLDDEVVDFLRRFLRSTPT